MSEQSKKRPSFFLRADYALECGFVDNLRREVSSEEYARICEKGGEPFSWREFAEFNRDRAATLAPRFLLISGVIRPGDTTPMPGLCDGKTWFFPDRKCGLFADVLARSAVVAPARKGEESRLVPTTLVEARKRWVHPDFAVLHDAETSTAEVLPWTAAYAEIRDWMRSR